LRKHASQYRPRGRIVLGRPRKGEFTEAGMATGLFCVMKMKGRRKKKKESKQCITFSMNIEVECLDFLLYMWEISD
jgi:hypothetical protein